ncbi:amino acid ABC transporter ATP-binding/permease protein [Staphylococcus canis]|uniref:ATP-binding cassette domain-containing protein n=1 Tax=Staphylococcus canis TaxID=2724942 RepID=A0ABS0T5I3_9STAP|nr:ATP-binding cassette domain-containing protein [Staphylococcus canis]MBI5974005.1 ATP-binding cassette domain-containing protein [Staphylococcus canis]
MSRHTQYHQIKQNKDLWIAIVIGVISGLVLLSMFFLSGYMITQSALGAPLYALMGLIVTVKLFGFLRAITRYIERLYSHRATFTMLRDVRVKLFKGLTPIVPNVFKYFKASDLLSRMVTSVESLQNIYLRVYYPPIVISLITLISMIVFYFISWIHSLIIGFTMLLSLFVMPWLFARKARVIKENVNIKQQDLMKHYYNHVLGQYELNRFNSVHLHQHRLDAIEQQLNQAEHREQTFHIYYAYLSNIVSMVALIVSLLLGIYQIKHHTLDAIYITSMILMILTLLEQLVSMTQVPYYKGETDLAKNEIETVTSMRSNLEGTEESGIQEIEQHALLWSLQDVTMFYEYRERPSLKNINLKIYKGEHIAIVGSSGSGKSSLLRILMGLYQVSEGECYVGTRNIKQIDTRDYLSHLNILLQNPHFFDGTVRDNLLNEASDDDYRKVLRTVGLSYVPLHHEITMNRTALSGGEFQRLALARLLLRDASIWIVDEPTSSLDHKHSHHIMKVLHDYAKTLIVATHDLAYIQEFDRVIEIKEGQVVNDTTPDDFIRKKNRINQ